MAVIEAILKRQYELIHPFLDERTKRLLAASTAKALGHCGLVTAAKITEITRQTIAEGIKELGDP